MRRKILITLLLFTLMAVALKYLGCVYFNDKHMYSNTLDNKKYLNYKKWTWKKVGKLLLKNRAWYYTATLLKDKSILIVGGTNRESITYKETEIYNTRTRKSIYVAPLNYARNSHTATLLPDGRVVVIGGYGQAINNIDNVLSSIEIFDPTTKKWTLGNPMSTPRTNHTATLLSNGLILVAGGCKIENKCKYLSRSELYDPINDMWKMPSSMHSRRTLHTATLLPDGRVLVAGGRDKRTREWLCIRRGCAFTKEFNLNECEIYDPRKNKWEKTSSMEIGRSQHVAIMQGENNVLAVGGDIDYDLETHSCELFNISERRWESCATVSSPILNHALVSLPDGRVIISGGDSSGLYSMKLVEIFDPKLHRWLQLPPMKYSRRYHSMFNLGDDKIIVLGGENDFSYKDSLIVEELIERKE